MALPPRIPKAPKRSSRWRSQAHCNFVRSHACCACGSTAGIEVAHVRIGSGAGLSQKPDDWRTVSLCKNCHARQHIVGELTFWGYRCQAPGDGRGLIEDWDLANPVELIDAFCKASPKAAEIRRIRQERGQ